MLYILSQIVGWIATVFRAGGMLAKKPLTVKLLVSVGNLGWLLSGIFTGNVPLIVSNALCLVVMVIELIRGSKYQRTKKTDGICGSEKMTTLLYDYYLASIEDAKKNLQGEDLEKCLQALKNYMDNFAEMDEATHRIAKDYGNRANKG